MIKCDYSPRSQLWIWAVPVLNSAVTNNLISWAYAISGKGIEQLGSSLGSVYLFFASNPTSCDYFGQHDI